MARKIWINSTKSFIFHTGEFTNPPKHFNVSIAAGHVLPMDDFIASKDLVVPLESFELIDPEKNVTNLQLPAKSSDNLVKTSAGMTIESGDVAAQKIRIYPDTKVGAYTVAAKTPDLSVDYPLPNGMSMKAKIAFYAKSYLTVNAWSTPSQVGHNLEIMPTGDISDVQVGDWVEFEVKFLGHHFSCNTMDMQYLLAKSPTFGGEAGGNDAGFFLAAYLINGKSRFRLPAAGQWMICAFAYIDVNEMTPSYIREFAGDAQRLFYHSTLTLNVNA